MTKREQKRFVQELMTSIKVETMEKINTGKIPETWDGIELRQFLADKFADAVARWQLLGKRKMDYEQAIIERNL